MAHAAGGTYEGRLAFDPDTNMHISEDGEPVVTDDGGATWRYAEEGDEDHVSKYHERVAVVDTTANELGRLSLEHGREKAEELVRELHPHHFEVHPEDTHYEEGAVLDGTVTHTRLKVDPDHKAAVITGHTAAYKGGSK